MKPRTLIAVQFALWAFFFSRVIPFSGTILLPVVWIYDKKVFVGYLIATLLDTIRYLPVAFGFPQIQKALEQLPPWTYPLIIPTSLAIEGLQISVDVWLAACFLKRKMKKLAPDLDIIRQHS